MNAASNAEGDPAAFDFNWSFNLKSGYPALSGGDTKFNTHFASQALVFEGLENIIDNKFTSPAPSSFFGAYQRLG